MSMNVHMKNIKFTVKGKPPVSMDHLTIRGNNVRWLGCIPETVAARECCRLTTSEETREYVPATPVT